MGQATDSPVRHVSAVFSPNRIVSSNVVRLLIAAQAGVAIALWWTTSFAVLPTPLEVLSSIHSLWFEQGLGAELIVSLGVNLQALGLTLAISLLLSYLTVVPFFRPMAAAVAKGRFLSLVGLTFVFTLLLGGGRPLKVSLLVFGMSVFFVTSMMDVVGQVPKDSFDHARTLRMGEWRAVWEVVVLGTADKAIDILRQNAAIGWMMLTMVEGIARSEGGVGAMLLNESKHFRLADVFAIQLVILFVGIVQDYAIGLLKQVICPYSSLTLERR
jgi:NitT/TauT family transport system permease protein